MTCVYRIKNWHRDYENSESRKIKLCRYVYTPNKHDGNGYRRMLAHPEGERLFGAWNALIQLASKPQGYDHRGTLADEDGPLTAEDIAFKTGFKPSTIELLLEFCSKKPIDWIECVEYQENIPLSPETSGQAPETSVNFGIELNRTELKGTTPPLPPSVESRLKTCIELYPKIRKRGEGGEESVHIGELAKKELRDKLTQNPNYPLEFAIEFIAKATDRPKNLMGFLQDLPAIEVLVPKMKRESSRLRDSRVNQGHGDEPPQGREKALLEALGRIQ